jgi:glycosyltransferase involved in cell wall biosynthesis
VPELVQNGTTGLLIEPGDEAALAAAMRAAIRNPELRKNLGDNAYEKVHMDFDVETNTEKLAATLWPDWDRQ